MVVWKERKVILLLFITYYIIYDLFFNIFNYYFSGEVGYFPSTFVLTLQFDEKSVITNIDTIGYEYLMLITLELPQPNKNENLNEKNICTLPVKNDNNNQEINALDKSETVSDTTNWLSLKDDISGKYFYYKDGDYTWKISS